MPIQLYGYGPRTRSVPTEVKLTIQRFLHALILSHVLVLSMGTCPIFSMLNIASSPGGRNGHYTPAGGEACVCMYVCMYV